MTHNQESGNDQDSVLRKPVSRRDLLRMAGVGGLGLMLGAGGMGGFLQAGRSLNANSSPARNTGDQVPFYGLQQSGIITPPQDFLCFAAFAIRSKKLADVRALFQKWTAAAAEMTQGRMIGEWNEQHNSPPSDTGEAEGLSPSKVTITFGVGPSFFDDRFGLSGKRPAELRDLPAFNGDQLSEDWCGGDIGIQVCANDMQVAFHAIRNLARIARGIAVLIWTQEGFQRTAGADPTAQTPRNLLGFKDGTGNPDVTDKKAMAKTVWVQQIEGPAWMENGSYMVTRRIRMRLEVWDRTQLSEQEATFGRYRSSGAPLGASKEFDPLGLDRVREDGEPVIPVNSHVRLAHGDGSVQILRRSYSYSSGIDRRTGQMDSGLFFVSYQRSIAKQFIPMQQRLSQSDKLNEYIVHVGSAVFACFPGVREGGYIGETLF
ncbi:iron uptake transporter deferrochelatase/peroxidase subunit [Paenibacillus sp. GCM10012307]|uniref:Deferrochelatase n=1 Tax=Paenibacillus roseus TaxID=2798579 RepID=A0A934J788_9BACL|nr:iron uptake transporter deferrochelatase/peroxidase subunit [Paenibacillus roseus]MBJ6361672.1 deferrochelatase/peroxidase EfeB [Paenibacillus roseus]